MSDFFTDLSSVGTSSMGGDYKMERTVKNFLFYLVSRCPKWANRLHVQDKFGISIARGGTSQEVEHGQFVWYCCAYDTKNRNEKKSIFNLYQLIYSSSTVRP